MTTSWGPTATGKLLTGSPDWKLTLDGDQFILTVGSRPIGGSVLKLADVAIKSGSIWATLQFPANNGQSRSLDGIPNSEAKALGQAIASAIARIQYQKRVTELLRNFKTSIAPVLAWSATFIEATKAQLHLRGWLTGEYIRRQIATKPTGMSELLSVPEVVKHIQAQDPEIQEAIKLWNSDCHQFADSVNVRHLAKQLIDCKSFFDTVEKSPMTKEQATAVVCFDNRVLLLASAGSGKTSTMVAKAGYALKNGYCRPERMLLLAFNNDAAKELGQRIKERLEPIGLPADKVLAKTFHAFGLDVIGQSTGKRPSLAPWVETGRDLEYLLEIVDDLKDKSSEFRANWDLFRIVLGQDLPQFGKESEDPDGWDRKTQKEGFWTLNNEVVKSRGEQMIANWLFYNGVNYQYEAAYEIETADAQHRQYRPDFYLPDAKAYLEHWALDAKGEPPSEFPDYKEGMAWKRQFHSHQGTILLETTAAGLWSGKAFSYLKIELPKLGLTLDPDPDRPTPGRKPIENPRLARTFRSFMTHAKSNRLTLIELRTRFEAGVAGSFRFRHKMFLDLFELLWAAWEERLKQEKCIDFEDMLNLATDCVEQGTWSSPYDMVMVDEFQDASNARARLIAALVKAPDKHLFAVGDDWQSINRFAGADLAVMTDFEQRFGRSITLKLETTFRCSQSLCDISSSFIQKNPKQLSKTVRSVQPAIESPVSVVRVENEHQIRSAIAMRLDEIAQTNCQGRQQKVLLLGRYQKDKDYLPPSYDRQHLDVTFITVHSSKGLEADHVILPRMTSETLGFPSRVADDPVLQLAMPRGDTFENAEERRLFYVALTRARSTVTLVTVAHKESAFVIELLKEHRIQVRNTDGSLNSDELCPVCSNGFLVQRKGKFGPFMGCSTYPNCKHTRNLDKSDQQQANLRK